MMENPGENVHGNYRWIEFVDYDSDELSDDDSYESDGDQIRLTPATFDQIKRNDPALTRIDKMFWGNDEFEAHVNWKYHGHIFKTNTHLKHLEIWEVEPLVPGDDGRVPSNANFCEFLGWIAMNSSIESFNLVNFGFRHAASTTLDNLVPFFQHNHNLRELRIDCCNLTLCQGRSVASALEKGRSLERVRFCVGLNGITDGLIELLIKSLKNHHHLKSIDFSNSGVNCGAVCALGNLIQNSKSKIEHIDLSYNLIDDACFIFLAKALAKSSTLKNLNLGRNPIAKASYQALARLLKNSSCSLEWLFLEESTIDDKSLASLAIALADNSTLKILDLSHNQSASQAGWVEFWEVFQNRKFALSSLDLSYNNIGSNTLINMSNALMNNTTLKSLILSNIGPIDSAGWEAIAAYLRCPLCVLEVLCLGNSAIDNEGGMTISNSLIHNSTLKMLNLSENEALTSTTWDTFSKSLCNRSSLADTFVSNHTLEVIDGLPDNEHVLLSLLRQNQNDNKREVARQKIIQVHFMDENMNIQEFHDMDPGILPHALAWMGRDATELCLMYKLLLGMPAVVENASRRKSEKRKPKKLLLSKPALVENASGRKRKRRKRKKRLRK